MDETGDGGGDDRPGATTDSRPTRPLQPSAGLGSTGSHLRRRRHRSRVPRNAAEDCTSVTAERRFRVHLRRQLNAEDEAALHQAGIEVERPASDPSAPEALLVEAADEAAAGLRVRA